MPMPWDNSNWVQAYYGTDGLKPIDPVLLIAGLQVRQVLTYDTITTIENTIRFNKNRDIEWCMARCFEYFGLNAT